MGKLLLFDLDDTLLRTDKSISANTIEILNRCREKGYIIGVSTSRSRQNCIEFVKNILPDILITSGGALAQIGEDCIYKAVFSVKETNDIIKTIREICGKDCEITVDTVDNHYWNYKTNPSAEDKTWGASIWTDYNNFDQEALKICAEIYLQEQAENLKEILNNCDCVKFADGSWYKFTAASVNKANVLKHICNACNITYSDIIAFGDDIADIGMLKIAGVGIAMGNALQEVKSAADIVIGNNNSEAIADYLSTII